MLPKKNRATKKAVEKVFQEGKFLNSPNLTLKYIVIPENKEVHISFTAPKSVAKLAVKRNLLRRRGYLSLEKHLKQFPVGFIGVFIFKKYEDDVLIIENEIKNILHKIH